MQLIWVPVPGQQTWKTVSGRLIWAVRLIRVTVPGRLFWAAWLVWLI
ncbi:hypothetical protein [Actinoplanes derwentensis]|nr:hypothetical protein [Actinoplanes derwentensis]